MTAATQEAAEKLTKPKQCEEYYAKREGLNPEELKALEIQESSDAQKQSKAQEELDTEEKKAREKDIADRGLSAEQVAEENKPAESLLAFFRETPEAETGATATPQTSAPAINGGIGGLERAGSSGIAYLRSIPPAAIAVGSFATMEALENGALLSVTTDRMARGIAYGFGCKDDGCGAIDCSGHTASATLATMEEINRQSRVKTGQDIYDMNRMRGLLGTGAAYQINNVARETDGGFVIDTQNEQSMRQGIAAIKPGMLLGVERNNVPSWAAGRPFNISHIGVVVTGKDGKPYVSESCSKGVTLTPLGKWLSYRNVKRVYAVNPFAMKKKGSEPIIQATFQSTTPAGPKPSGQHHLPEEA